ncbi:MAG: hypothetical protein ACI4OT_04790 [Bacilli bacterium]
MEFKLIERDATGKSKELKLLIREENKHEFKIVEINERVTYPDEPKKLTKFKRNKQY